MDQNLNYLLILLSSFYNQNLAYVAKNLSAKLKEDDMYITRQYVLNTIKEKVELINSTLKNKHKEVEDDSKFRVAE